MVVSPKTAYAAMNTPITFPPPEPPLRLARPSAEKWAATLAEERRRLNEDQEALREREQNLRDYEARLRVLQAEIEAGRGPAAATPRGGTTAAFSRPSSQTPFADDAGLQAAWDKLYRARELLEAEQRNLRDDRIALRDLDAQIKQREEALAAREAKVAEHEALLTAAASSLADEGPKAASAMGKLTSAPFNLARSMFGKK